MSQMDPNSRTNVFLIFSFECHTCILKSAESRATVTHLSVWVFPLRGRRLQFPGNSARGLNSPTGPSVTTYRRGLYTLLMRLSVLSLLPRRLMLNTLSPGSVYKEETVVSPSEWDIQVLPTTFKDQEGDNAVCLLGVHETKVQKLSEEVLNSRSEFLKMTFEHKNVDK